MLLKAPCQEPALSLGRWPQGLQLESGFDVSKLNIKASRLYMKLPAANITRSCHLALPALELGILLRGPCWGAVGIGETRRPTRTLTRTFLPSQA